MKITSLFFLYSIVSLSKSAKVMENDLKSESLTIFSVSPARRQGPMFPKRNMKFIVKPHTQNDEDYYKESENKSLPTNTRKPLMAKFIPKTKIHNAKTTEQVTRKSLMKVRTYTVKMSPKFQNKDMTNQDLSKNEKRFKIDVKANKPFTKRVESEELESSQTKITEVIKDKKDITEPNIINKYLAEEEQDRNEFIFLEKTNEDIKGILNDFIDVESELETTTKSLRTTNLRRKRKSNIIEEDNATTASAFKYTGRDSRLTQDLYYKNINH